MGGRTGQALSQLTRIAVATLTTIPLMSRMYQFQVASKAPAQHRQLS